MSIVKVIQVANGRAVDEVLFKAFRSGKIATFSDVHGNCYAVCHATNQGYIKNPTDNTLYSVFDDLWSETKSTFVNLICCYADKFKETYSGRVDRRTDPVTGSLSRGTEIKVKHVFAEEYVPANMLTWTEVKGNYIVLTIGPR